MKIKNSKKGFTLVELVVTIAIMSITASMGVGIFVMSLKNYVVASEAATAQQNAVALEEMVREYFKIGYDLDYVGNFDVATDRNETASITYFYAIGDGSTICTDYYNADEDIHTTLSFNGISEFSVEYKLVANSDSSDSAYTMVTYTIVSVGDYELSGSIVLNNGDILSSEIGVNYLLDTSATNAIAVLYS